MNSKQLTYIKAKVMYDATKKVFFERCKAYHHLMENDDTLMEYCEHETRIEFELNMPELRRHLREAEQELIKWGHEFLSADPRYDTSMDLVFEQTEYCVITAEDTCKLLAQLNPNS